jgi:hypothetical protein
VGACRGSGMGAHPHRSAFGGSVMGAVNAGLRITEEGAFALVLDERGNVNVEALHAFDRPPATLNFLALADILPLVHKLAAAAGAPLSSRWDETYAVLNDQAEFARALKGAGIAYRCPGDPGRRSKVAGGRGIGEKDYRPGYWLHPELVLPLAKWIAQKQQPFRKTPLMEFVETNLRISGGAAGRKSAKPKGVAMMFASEVSEKTLATLKKIDAVMIGDGESASDRLAVMRAHLDNIAEA